MKRCIKEDLEEFQIFKQYYEKLEIREFNQGEKLWKFLECYCFIGLDSFRLRQKENGGIYLNK